MSNPSRSLSLGTPADFVSTALPYVNAAPHLGFALEVVLADAIARHARARGRDTWFTSGTDDHSTKNVRAAAAAAVPVRAFVDEAAEHYRGLGELLGASYDAFVRTSADALHVDAVRELWRRCERAGDLYKRKYRGLYCVGCEQFFDQVELEGTGGVCPEHGTAPEIVEEENWFFRLSRHESALREAIASRRIRIHPAERANEILRFLDAGLRDVSVSRSRLRTHGWGIPVPSDPEQVIYVWFDALANYLSSLGFPTDDARVERYWHGASRRVHVLGKGIARFHAVLWPALLRSAGCPLPTDLLVHGYLTVAGRKIGKSLGNGIDPSAVVARYGRDGLRWFLLRHVGPTNDADVSDARIASAYASDLANGLGNLVARTLTLVRTAGPTSAVSGIDPSGEALVRSARVLPDVVDEALERFAVHEALRAIAELVAEGNAHLARTEPWALTDARARATPADAERLAALQRTILHHTLVALGALAHELVPFLPDTAARLQAALVTPAERPPILFPRVDGGPRIP